MLAPSNAATTYKNITLDNGGWFVGFAPHSSGRLYGYGDVFGVWRSDDRGESWSPLQLGFRTLDNFVMGVAVKTDDANTLAFITEGTKLYKSTDGGASWNETISLVGDKSRYYGSTQLINHPTPGRHNEWLVARKRTGMTGQLWRSTNGLSSTGTDWVKLGGTTFDSNIKPHTVYIHKNFPNHIWVGAADTASGGAGGGLYVSVDNGTSFTRVWGAGKTGSQSAPPYVDSIVRRDDGTALLGSNVAGVIITATDWNNPSTYSGFDAVNRVAGSGVTGVAVLPTGEFISGQDSTDPAIGTTMRRSDTTPTSGEVWTTLTPYLATDTPVPSWTTAPTNSTTKIAPYRSMITIDPLDSTRWYTTGGKSPFISTNSGATWKYPPIGNGLAAVNTYSVSFPLNASNASDANKVFITGGDQGIFTLTDGGASGNAATSVTAQLPMLQLFHDIMISADGQTVVGAGLDQSNNKSRLVRSTDGGMQWSAVDLSTTNLPLSREGITRSVMSRTDPQDFLVMLGSSPGYPNNNPGIWRTFNGGASWVKATGSIPDNPDTGDRYDMERAWLDRGGPDFPNHRYATLRNSGFHRSLDGGSTWEKPTNQPTVWATGLSVDQAPGAGGTIWCANDSSPLKRSTDQGLSWQTVGPFSAVKRLSVYNGRVAAWAKQSGDDGWKLYYSANNGVNWSVHTYGNESTPGSIRYGHFTNVAVDPYRVGQLWVTGNTSVHVVDTAATPPPTSGDVTYSFSDVGHNSDVNGTHGGNSSTPGINFGSGVWGAGDYFGFHGGWFWNNSNSSSFTLPSGTRLKSIRLSTAVAGSTWSISDNSGSNLTRSGEFLSVDSPITVNTSWTQPGSTVTITFSAGWDSGIDDITYGSGGTTPPPPPTSGDVTYDFSDIGDNSAVDGTKGGINFGDGVWGAGNYFGFHGGWFWNNASNSRSFTLPSGTRLKSIKLSTGVANSTWSISDNSGANQTRSGNFGPANTPMTVNLTNWTQPGSTVTITFSASWDSGIDDIVYGQ